MRINNPQETREKLLQAAALVIAARGANNLTLENVAAAAKVSKGGLLHHFPNKEALLGGLMQQLISVFEDCITRELQNEPDTAGRWLRAYIRATFSPSPEEQALTTALASLISSQPNLLSTLKTSFEFAERSILADGLGPARATAIRLACDGLWFSELSGMIQLQTAERQALLEELLELAQ